MRGLFCGGHLFTGPVCKVVFDVILSSFGGGVYSEVGSRMGAFLFASEKVHLRFTSSTSEYPR